jgi:outer membrane lipoprotein SlyB
MRALFFAALALAGLGVASPDAHAIGCLSGGAAGALAGHMAGHGVLGAVGGCIAGHTWHKHQMRQQDMQNLNSYEARRRSEDPQYQSPYTH